MKYLANINSASRLTCYDVSKRTWESLVITYAKTVSVSRVFAEMPFSKENIFGERELYSKNDFLRFILVNNHVKSHYILHNLTYCQLKFGLSLSFFFWQNMVSRLRKITVPSTARIIFAIYGNIYLKIGNLWNVEVPSYDPVSTQGLFRKRILLLSAVIARNR